MSQFTIEEVLGQEEFSTDHGSFIAYEVRFAGEQGAGTAQHKRKASSPAPTAGEIIDGELVHKNGRVELKRVWKDSPPGGGKPGGGGKWQPKTPEERLEERRRSAQIRAIELLAVEVSAGQKFTDQRASELLKPRIEFFFNDLEGVLK